MPNDSKDQTSYDVFLSYSSKDSDFMKLVLIGLQRYGFKVWWDDNIEGGTHWRNELMESLDASQSVVVLWSNNSAGSLYVMDEASRNLNKFIGVHISSDKADFLFGTGNIQYLSLEGWSGTDIKNAQFLELVDAINLKLKEENQPIKRVPLNVKFEDVQFLFSEVNEIFGIIDLRIYEAAIKGDTIQDKFELTKLINQDRFKIKKNRINEVEKEKDRLEKKIELKNKSLSKAKTKSRRIDEEIVKKEREIRDTSIDDTQLARAKSDLDWMENDLGNENEKVEALEIELGKAKSKLENSGLKIELHQLKKGLEVAFDEDILSAINNLNEHVEGLIYDKESASETYSTLIIIKGRLIPYLKKQIITPQIDINASQVENDIADKLSGVILSKGARIEQSFLFTSKFFQSSRDQISSHIDKISDEISNTNKEEKVKETINALNAYLKYKYPEVLETEEAMDEEKIRAFQNIYEKNITDIKLKQEEASKLLEEHMETLKLAKESYARCNDELEEIKKICNNGYQETLTNYKLSWDSNSYVESGPFIEIAKKYSSRIIKNINNYLKEDVNEILKEVENPEKLILGIDKNINDGLSGQMKTLVNKIEKEQESSNDRIINFNKKIEELNEYPEKESKKHKSKVDKYSLLIILFVGVIFLHTIINKLIPIFNDDNKAYQSLTKHIQKLLIIALTVTGILGSFLLMLGFTNVFSSILSNETQKFWFGLIGIPYAICSGYLIYLLILVLKSKKKT